MKKVVKSRSSLPATAKLSSAKTNTDNSKHNADGSKLVANQIRESSNSMVAMMEDLSQQISGIQLVSAQPPMEWEFDFIRDGNGLLKKINATATIEKKRIN